MIHNLDNSWIRNPTLCVNPKFSNISHIYTPLHMVRRMGLLILNPSILFQATLTPKWGYFLKKINKTTMVIRKRKIKRTHYFHSEINKTTHQNEN